MDYKIIVLGSDDTLTNRDKIIMSRTKEALMKAREAGSVVALASGRPAVGMESLAKELELSHFGGYILPYNEGVITNCKIDETVFSLLLPRESNQKIIGLAEEHRVDILTCEGGEIITNSEECPYATAGSNINRLPLRRVEDMKPYVDFRMPKFLMLDDGDYLVTVESKVRAVMGRDFSVYRSEPYFLEIMPRGTDKAQSLARLLEALGFEREQMVTYGGGCNNLTIVKYADLGVAMGNAVLPVRQAVDYTTASNDHDGVGAVVEKFILS